MNLHRASTEPKSSDRTFALVMAAAFALLCFVPKLRHSGEPRWYWLPIAFLFLAFAFVAPGKLRRVHMAWLSLGLLLQKFVSPVFLGVIYFLFFTPVGLLLRIFRPDPLRRAYDAKAETYWLRRGEEQAPGAGMKRQF